MEGGIFIFLLHSGGDDGLICRLCVSMLNELYGHIIGSEI